MNNKEKQNYYFTLWKNKEGNFYTTSQYFDIDVLEAKSVDLLRKDLSIIITQKTSIPISEKQIFFSQSLDEKCNYKNYVECWIECILQYDEEFHKEDIENGILPVIYRNKKVKMATIYKYFRQSKKLIYDNGTQTYRRRNDSN